MTGPRPAPSERWRPFVLGPDRATRPKPAPTGLELEACLREADAALDGRFTVLGYGTVTVDTDGPGWHQDPVHDFTWPACHHRSLGPVPGRADIKVPWEVSRLQWLVALARAYTYTDDSRYRKGATRLLRSWADANPVGSGPNWTNAMEAGIRATNLVWAAEILDDPEFTTLVGGTLRDHGWFILANLEYTPRLTSNHYLADLVGLVHIGGALRHSSAGRLWLRLGSRQLQREILKQFHEDGSNFEASTGYHRLSTELALVGLLALRRLHIPVRPETEARFLSAVEALAVLTKPDGLLPAVGDDDGGLVVGLQSARDARDASPVIAAASAVSDPRTPEETAAPEMAQWCGAAGRRPPPGRPPHPSRRAAGTSLRAAPTGASRSAEGWDSWATEATDTTTRCRSCSAWTAGKSSQIRVPGCTRRIPVCGTGCGPPARTPRWRWTVRSRTASTTDFSSPCRTRTVPGWWLAPKTPRAVRSSKRSTRVTAGSPIRSCTGAGSPWTGTGWSSPTTSAAVLRTRSWSVFPLRPACGQSRATAAPGCMPTTQRR